MTIDLQLMDFLLSKYPLLSVKCNMMKRYMKYTNKWFFKQCKH